MSAEEQGGLTLLAEAVAPAYEIVVGERSLDAITDEIHEVRQEARRTVLAQALRIGALLFEARPLFVGNQKAYMQWAFAEFGYRDRHVFRLLQLAKELPHVAAIPADSSIRQALAALIPPTGMFSSDTPEWYTPPEIIDRVVTLFGAIDLDPCADAGRGVPAARHFTVDDDGLSQVWSGRVYMNIVKPGERGWVMDRAYGESRERAFAEVLLADTMILRIEHKADLKCRHTGNICVEFEQVTGPSGLSTSRAERWAFELLDGSWLLVPTHRLREVATRARNEGLVRDTGDFGNKSALVPACWLIRPPHKGGCAT